MNVIHKFTPYTFYGPILNNEHIPWVYHLKYL